MKFEKPYLTIMQFNISDVVATSNPIPCDDNTGECDFG